MVHQLDTVPGRTCSIDGKTYLFFSGYDYLAMQTRPEFITLIKEGIDKYGLIHPSSRISNTQLSIYHQLEEALSALTSCKDTVTFSSGYLAGQAASKVLADYKAVYKAPGSHPALSFDHHIFNAKNFEDWSQEIVSIVNNNFSDEAEILCFDAVNIFKPAINDVSFLRKINPQQKLIVMIDDSHGIGIIGKEGKGASTYTPQLKNIEYIFIYSLSKAFNITGGAVSCSKFWADKLRELSCYSSSTALSPAMAYAFLHAEDLYAAQLQKLKKNISFFLCKPPGKNLLTHPDLPVAVVSYAGIEDLLFRKEIIISSFNYPSASSQKINRIVLNASHKEDDIDGLYKALH